MRLFIKIYDHHIFQSFTLRKELEYFYRNLTRLRVLLVGFVKKIIRPELEIMVLSFQLERRGAHQVHVCQLSMVIITDSLLY